jgi:hypothetical protein
MIFGGSTDVAPAARPWLRSPWRERGGDRVGTAGGAIANGSKVSVAVELEFGCDARQIFRHENPD